MSVEINGIPHIQISVNDFAAAAPFRERLCHFPGMSTLLKGPETVSASTRARAPTSTRYTASR